MEIKIPMHSATVADIVYRCFLAAVAVSVRGIRLCCL